MTVGLPLVDTAFCFLNSTANKIARDIGCPNVLAGCCFYNNALGYRTGKVRAMEKNRDFIQVLLAA